MERFKGTEGEWKIESSEVVRHASTTSISPYWKQISSFVNNGTEEAKANAKLIAAAPDLLRELICLIGNIEELGTTEEDMRYLKTYLKDGKKAIEKTLK